MDTLKMYIVVKESVPVGVAMVAAAHASLAAYLRFEGSLAVREWLCGPFYKVICKVNDKEFKKAKECKHRVVVTESSLDDQEVAIAFEPRGDDEWPKAFKFFRLYR